MTEKWDEVRDLKAPPRELVFAPKPAQTLLGLALGVVSVVFYPGLLFFLPLAAIVPAMIALGSWAIKPARPLAAGFAAASVAWLSFVLTLWLCLAIMQ